MNWIAVANILKSGLFPTPSIYSRVDSLTHKTIFLVAVFLAISTWYNFSLPVRCVLPTEQRPETLPWVESFCQTHPDRLFYHNVSVVWNVGHRLENPLSFYTGTSFVFFAFAVIIYFSFTTWSVFINSSTPVKRVLEDLKNASENIPYATENIQPCADLLLSWVQSNGCILSRSKTVLFYAGFKVWISLCFTGFILFMNDFLSMGDIFWATKLLSDILLETYIIEDRFPIDVSCKANKMVGIEATIETTFISCNMPLMAVYKYAYLFAWFWTVTIAVLNVLQFLHLVLFYLSRQRRTIGDYCWDGKRRPTSRFLWTMDPFIKELSPNGVFLIELVKSNLGEIAAKSLCVEMWNSYNTEMPPVFTI